MSELFDITIRVEIWWVVFYAIFVGLNILGIEATMRFTVIVCFMSLAILAFFFVDVAVQLLAPTT